MRREIKTKTGRLLDASDLTVAAPIKAGLVTSLDAVSYKTRAERLLQLLQLGRLGQHEFELTRVLSDAVERVGLIHAVRVGIIEPQNLLMLSVTFDGDWESYMRTVWQKVARLLDLIFCHTEAYTFGWESSYDDWMAWLRSRQVNTPFLYSQPGLTFADGELLRGQEWLQRQTACQESAARLLRITPADQLEFQLGSGDKNDPRFPGSRGYATDRGGDFLIVRQSVRTLAALHRLTDVFLPGTHDGLVLHRAGRETLSMLTDLIDGGSLPFTEQLNLRFADALKWLSTRERLPATRVPPPLQGTLAETLPERDWQDVQAGILSPLQASHGCALMLRFENAVDLADFLRALPLTHHAAPFNADGISVNLALSTEGLRLAGFTDDELRTWPDAFYQGMAHRAGLLGDVRANHPRQWLLPARLPAGTLSTADTPAGDEPPVVQLSEVHALLTLRLARDRAKDLDDARRQLLKPLEKWTRPAQRLALQWLVRLVGKASSRTTEHFGWLDEQTDPKFDKAAASSKARDHGHVGEALCGHPNAADRAPANDAPAVRWLRNGSFLVVRKLRQDVAALESALDNVEPALDKDLVRAKLMGRWHDAATRVRPGTPLVAVPPATQGSNHFSFAGDPDGALCPLHAHIRRGNPRQPTGSLSNDPRDPSPQAPVRPPRLMRRGMSYGPTYEEDPATTDRGLFFMAYNASLAEQFELLQHWMAGANSSGGDSAQADALLGVATPGQTRSCVFHHDQKLYRVPLEPAVPLNEVPQALVRLEWGAYWFSPALNVVADIARRAATAREAPLWNAERGEAELQQLLALERREGPDAARLAWKEALEDPESLLDHRASSIWAAIRRFHDGRLRCAYGVLVGDPAGVQRIVKDEVCYTAAGYQDRMRNSFGTIFLAHDTGEAGHTYENESAHVVDAIRALPVEQTYLRTRQLTRHRLQKLWTITRHAARDANDLDWRLQFEVRELLDHVLGRLCIDWFGLRPGVEFDCGGLDPAADSAAKPRNPGHFASPSRLFFQPRPGAHVRRIGEAHGQALFRAMQALLTSPDPKVQRALKAAPLTQAVLANPLCAQDPSYAARTAVGVVMGFVPTVDGTLRRALGEWLREGLFWRLRGTAPALATCPDAMQSIGGHLVRAMQLRAAPELLWRTARVDHELGSGDHAVQVKAGERMVAGLMSATHQHWEQGSGEYHAIFGGDRDAADPPTHACPGAKAGFGVMLGFLAALLETRLPLRPGPAGLTFEACGTRERTPAAPSQHRTESSNENGQTKDAPKVRMLALGDSWLSEGILTQFSLTRSLRERGYACERDHNLARATLTLRSVADRALVAASLAPDVDMVLVDGGGNDVHQRNPLFFADPQNPVWAHLADKSRRANLDDLLQGANGKVALNAKAVCTFIDSADGLAGQMERTLAALAAVQDGPPIVVVAYDHPFPDGRGPFGTRSEWLAPAFERLGLDMGQPAELAVAAGVMADLINRLNKMNMTVATEVTKRFPDARIFAIDLTGTLKPNQPADLWDNELHPNEKGFGLLADRLIALLPSAISGRSTGAACPAAPALAAVHAPTVDAARPYP